MFWVERNPPQFMDIMMYTKLENKYIVMNTFITTIVEVGINVQRIHRGYLKLFL